MKWKDWNLNLKVRLIGELLTSMLFWMYFPFLTLYFIDEFGKQITGILMTIPPILGVVANLFGGYLTDRYGRKRMMVIASGSQAFLLFIFAMSPNPWIDFIVFVLMAFMGSFYYPASQAMVADLTTDEQRRSIFAAFYASMNIGVVIGPFLGAIYFFEYRFWLLLASAIAELIYFIVLVNVVKETLPANMELPEKGNIVKEQIKSYKVIFTDKVFLLYILGGVFIAQIFMQMDLYMGVYLKNYVPVQPFISIGDWTLAVDGIKLFGWMIAENGLMVVLLTMFVNKLVIDWSDKQVLIFSSLLFGISFWLMAFTQNAWLLLSLMFLFTIAELIRTPVTQNFVAKLAPENKRGQYMGASSLQFSVGRALAPLSITLAAWLGPLEIFSLLFILAGASALLYLLMFRIMEKKAAFETVPNPNNAN